MTEQKANGLIGRDWFTQKDKRRFVEFEIDGQSVAESDMDCRTQKPACEVRF